MTHERLGTSLTLGILSLLLAGTAFAGVYCVKETNDSRRACQMIPSGTGDCPIIPIQDGDCPDVMVAENGFSNSTPATATCIWQNQKKDENGVCQPTTTQTYVAACNRASGNVCHH